MRVALLCDVDQTVYHVGDEAIAATSAEQLRRRGHEVTMISRQEKYGPAGARNGTDEPIPALVFPWPDEDRLRYLGEIRAVLAGDTAALPPEDKLFAIIERVKGVDALVIGGGGSLNSRFGWLLSERLATALVFASMGKPVLLTGQSLGPTLSLNDRDALGELLGLCALVGVRDEDSYRLARQLCPDHPALFQTIDDATLFAVDWTAPKANRISVTCGDNPFPFPEGDYVQVMASLIDGLADRTGAEIEFIPHMADPDAPASDVRIHELVASRLDHPSTQRPIEPAETAGRRLAASSWVLTTRFHPVVFGLMAAASVLPVGLDEYGLSRMDGALRNWGWDRAVVPFASLWDPSTGAATDALAPVLDALVAGAQRERAHLESRRAGLLDAGARWWDRVAAMLAQSAEPPEVTPPMPTESRFGAEIAQALTPMTPWVPTGGQRLVSVIMRTKDRGDLLDRAVRDVLAQTFADWQLVVVNDAGDPGAVDEVLARYRQRLGDRLTLVNNPESHGMEAASNLGLANSQSEFVVVHDDDDAWQPRFLQQAVDYLRNHPGEPAVAARTVIVNEKLVGRDYVEYERFPVWPDMHSVRLVDFMTINRIVPICLLYRRSIHEQIGLYIEELPVIGDYAFHLRLLMHHDVGFIEEALAEWHLRPLDTRKVSTSNSLIALRLDHESFDLALRDRLLREWAEKNGLGLPMFIARTVHSEADRLDGRLHEVLGRLDAIERQLQDTDHAVRNGGGFNYAKRKYFAARSLAQRATAPLRRNRG